MSVKKYIDVSAHQGLIDFEKLKGNVDGVIIRAGYGQNNIDKQFIRNVTECNRLEIPCGGYWFSYAYTADMATKEAQYFIEAVKPYKMELPLAFDYEYDSVTYGQKRGAKITKALVQNMTNAFCESIEAAGYWCWLYANPDFINRYFGELAGTRYDLWLAQWPSKVDVNNPPRKCGLWQWGTSIVPGITSGVDTNAAYLDYQQVITEKGLNNLPVPEPEPELPWYAAAMFWVKDNDICDDTDPENPVTKAEVAQMILNYHKKFSGK